ncbi:MAG: phosphoethanolamine transferase [bacterium]
MDEVRTADGGMSGAAFGQDAIEQRQGRSFRPGWVFGLSALFIVLFGNHTFFSRLLQAYPTEPHNFLFLGAVALMLWAGVLLLMLPFSFRWAAKPILAVLFTLTAVAAYFMDAYATVIDTEMVNNIWQTDGMEAKELLTFRLLGYWLLLGLLPSFLVWRLPLRYPVWWKGLAGSALSIVLCGALMLALLWAYGARTSHLFKQNLAIPYANPVYPVVSLVEWLRDKVSAVPGGLQRVAKVASLRADVLAHGKPRLVVMVVGESLRADHLSLNGYGRPTTPLLAQQGVVSFPSFFSCGTSTAWSVPCMFSSLDQASFTRRRGDHLENALDLASRAGVDVLWLDNNSSSKGVAKRVPAINFTRSDTNPLCDRECRDLGMLAGLERFVSEHESSPERARKPGLVVMHQKGSHGPAYYRRYPPAFAVFQPACQSPRLKSCSRESIVNAYDNALRHTDYVLAHTIEYLKRLESRFDVALFYVSDHGESLGEHGVYLHGMPSLMAPDAQVRVAALMWLGQGLRVNPSMLGAIARQPHSHDEVFHTLLGMVGVATDAYDAQLDILAPLR